MYDLATVERVRTILAAKAGVVEKRMVGGISFNLGGKMVCGVTGDALMIRVGRDGREQALAQPHARPMELGGRQLSGFICVDPLGFRTDAELAAWIDRGIAFVADG